MRIVFAFNHCCEFEIGAYERGEVPSHRLFGFDEIRRLGQRVDFVPFPQKLAGCARKPSFWKLYQAAFVAIKYFMPRRADAVVATHEACALPLLLLRRLGILRVPVVVLTVAACAPRNTAGLRRKIFGWLLRGADAITCYTPDQTRDLFVEFGIAQSKLHFLPFGIDVSYFAEGSGEQGGEDADQGFCAAVGANEGKDFPTLVAALPEGCRLEVVTDRVNADIIASCVRASSSSRFVVVRRDIDIREIRDLYRRASFHIIPLFTSRFSSGQTVLLENMSCGRAVIVTNTAAISSYVQPNVTAVLVEPGDVNMMRTAIDELRSDPARAKRIGANAAAAVRERFSSMHTAEKLLRIAHLVGVHK
jgi:glycosyltransferase involved in cell wall biosynthesis